MSDLDFSCCGLINGACSRQIQYDIEKHDKMIYQQGYADAIDEFADTMQLVKLTECDDVPRELIEAIEKQIGICALRVKEKMLKEQKNDD